MYQITESTELNKRRLNIRLSKSDGQYFAYELRMLENNSIPGCLVPHIREMTDAVIICYEIGERTSLEELCRSHKLTAEPVRSLMIGISLVLSSVGGYFLNHEEVVFSPNNIYYDGNSFEFIYCPGQKKPVQESLAELATYLMDMIDYDDSEAVKPVYRLYGSSKCESSDPEDIGKLLLREDESERDREEEKTDEVSQAPKEDETELETVDGTEVSENPVCESGGKRRSTPEGGGDFSKEGLRGRILRFSLLVIPRAVLLYLLFISFSGGLMTDRRLGGISYSKLLFALVFVYALSGAYDFIVLVIREKFLAWMKDQLQKNFEKIKTRLRSGALFVKNH